MIKVIRKIYHCFSSDENGVAAVEFALGAPIFFALVMGVYDVSNSLYVRSVLQGSVDAAGRQASLENTSTTEIDEAVERSLGILGSAKTDDLVTERLFFENYSDIARPEDLVDANNNGLREPGECFIDRNGNGQWDTNVGILGRGGAQDVVIYKVTYNRDRIFPLWSLVGLDSKEEIVAQTILRNQPFSAQAQRNGSTICS